MVLESGADLVDRLTKARLKRMVKTVELQKAYLKRQKRLDKIISLYRKLLDSWFAEFEGRKAASKHFMFDSFASGQDVDYTQTELASQTELVSHVAKPGAETAQAKGGQAPTLQRRGSSRTDADSEFSGDVQSIIEKDEMIKKITNASSENGVVQSLSMNSSVRVREEYQPIFMHTKSPVPHLPDAVDEEELLKRHQKDIDTLRRYLSDFFKDPEALKVELGNEERIAEGYRFLIYGERKNIIQCQQQLLAKYSGEGKLMKMLQGMYSLPQSGYRQNVVRIMETTYDFDATGSEWMVSDFFGLSQLRWSLTNLEIGQLEREFELTDLKMEANELEDMVNALCEKCRFLHVLDDVERFPDLIMEDYPDQWGKTFSEIEALFDDQAGNSTSDSSSDGPELPRLDSLDLPEDVFPLQRHLGVDELELRKQRQARQNKGRAVVLLSGSSDHEEPSASPGINRQKLEGGRFSYEGYEAREHSAEMQAINPETQRLHRSSYVGDHEGRQEEVAVSAIEPERRLAEKHSYVGDDAEPGVEIAREEASSSGSTGVPKELEHLEKINEESVRFFQKRTEIGREKKSLLTRKKAIRRNSSSKLSPPPTPSPSISSSPTPEDRQLRPTLPRTPLGSTDSTWSIGSATSLLDRSPSTVSDTLRSDTDSVGSSDSETSLRRRAKFSDFKTILVDGVEVQVADMSVGVGSIPSRHAPRQLSNLRRKKGISS